VHSAEDQRLFGNSRGYNSIQFNSNQSIYFVNRCVHGVIIQAGTNKKMLAIQKLPGNEIEISFIFCYNGEGVVITSLAMVP
jgi:hypothetical protein